MGAQGGITIRGLKEVSDVLKKFDYKQGVRLIRAGFRRALIPVRDRAKSLAPVKSGTLAGDIKIMAGRSRNRNLISQRVVIGKSARRGNLFYGAEQELGWLIGRRALGKKRTHRPGSRFLREAYNQEGPGAALKAEQYIWEAIDRALTGKK